MPQMPIPGQHIDILHPVHPHNTAVWFVLLFVYCIVQYNAMPYKRDICNTMALWHCSADPGGPHTKLHGPPQLGSSTCDSIDLHHFSRERGASRRIEACPLAGDGPTDQPTNPPKGFGKTSLLKQPETADNHPFVEIGYGRRFAVLRYCFHRTAFPEAHCD